MTKASKNGRPWFFPLATLYFAMFQKSIQSDCHDCVEDCLATRSIHQKLLTQSTPSEKISFLKHAASLNVPPGKANAKALNFQYEGVCLAGFSSANCRCGQMSFS